MQTRHRTCWSIFAMLLVGAIVTVGGLQTIGRSPSLSRIGQASAIWVLTSDRSPEGYAFMGVSMNELPIAALGDRQPERVIQDSGCTGCHRFDGPEPLVGPSLWDIGARRDEAYIRQKILHPNAIVAEGYPAGVMPQDLSKYMTAYEFELLIQWLRERKGSKSP